METVIMHRRCYTKRIMQKLFTRSSAEELQAFTRHVARVDIGINITAGTGLVIMPQLANQLLFGAPVISWWVLLVMGIGFLLFAAWQVLALMRADGFSRWNLRFAAWMAWVPVLALTMGLLSPLGGQLLDGARVFLWAANGYMVLLGGLYWVGGARSAGK